MTILGNIWGGFAYYNHARGNLEKAEALYNKAYGIGITNPNIMIAYGVLVLRKGDFLKAKEIFENSLRMHIKPNVESMAKLNYSLALWKLGDNKKAIDILWKLNDQYKSARVYGALGYLLIEDGDYDKAMEYNLEALQYDERDPVILDNMGQLYYRMGALEKAATYFEKAINIKPEQGDSHFYLACIAYDQSDNEKAVDELEKALECKYSPLNTINLDQVREKLNHVKGKLQP